MLAAGPATRSPLRILTWHVHGSYLYYLSQLPHHFYVPVKPGRPQGYGGRSPGRAWPPNLHEIDAERIRELTLDAVIFQSPGPYAHDQYALLTEAQRALPYLYLEHDPPREQPTDTRHLVNDPSVLLVHVTHFNALMWDSGRTPVQVIRHGVALPPKITFTGEIPRGLVVVNDLGSRGRRLGWDVFERVRSQIPLDLVGMGSKALGGLGEISSERLAAFMARYRFFFNPIRYTSLGLAVCEAMAVGVPIIGLATTEMPGVIRNGVSGYVYNDIEEMIRRMRELLARPDRAKALGEGARRYASVHFSLARFARDWDTALAAATQLRLPHSDNVRAGGLNESAHRAYK